LPSTEKADRKNHVRSSPDIISHNSGPPLALPPPATVASTSGIPNEYEFEILRLRRRVESLECTVRDRDERNVAAIAMLEDEMQFWRTYLHDHVDATYADIRRRVVRIESTLAVLKEKGSRIYPPLEIPAAWRKT
jgi:hypothetical protein